MSKIKLDIWIPKEGHHVELYNDEENILSEPLWSKEELRDEVKYWEKKGYDLTSVKKRLKTKKYKELLRTQFSRKKLQEVM